MWYDKTSCFWTEIMYLFIISSILFWIDPVSGALFRHLVKCQLSDAIIKHNSVGDWVNFNKKIEANLFNAISPDAIKHLYQNISYTMWARTLKVMIDRDYFSALFIRLYILLKLMTLTSRKAKKFSFLVEKITVS
jgi:hypothetical protein